MSRQREGLYKTQLTGRIYDRFGDRCVVLRMNANNRQGIPDILVIFEGGYWAALEAKTGEKAPHRPNQPHYVARLGNMCFAAFIYPENEEAVLNELQQEYETHWATRIS